jgi:hypothetical protein
MFNEIEGKITYDAVLYEIYNAISFAAINLYPQ